MRVFQDEPGFAGVAVVQELLGLLQAEVQDLAGHGWCVSGRGVFA